MVYLVKLYTLIWFLFFVFYLLQRKNQKGREDIFAISPKPKGIFPTSKYPLQIKPPKPLLSQLAQTPFSLGFFCLSETSLCATAMAIHALSRSLPKTLTLASFFSRSLATSNAASAASRSAISSLSLLRPLVAAGVALRRVSTSAPVRGFATRSTTSSLNDPNPNWSNRPPKETILLDGCDFEHWLVVVEKPEGDPTRDEIIDSYIKTLAKVIGR
jgi:hypothetical protein